jgi:hypothetical protein
MKGMNASSRCENIAPSKDESMMMFRPMREEEYPAYLEYFIADYAREIAANYRLSAEDSLTKAKREIAEDLPEGVNTPGQVLLSL